MTNLLNGGIIPIIQIMTLTQERDGNVPDVGMLSSMKRNILVD